MPRNLTVLDELHEMFTSADIEHFFNHGDTVITVFRGDHSWTVSEDCIIYWGGSADDCKIRWHETPWAADAYDYIADVYSEVQ